MVCGVSHFSSGTGSPNASGYPLFLSIAEADNTFARAYTVIRALREKPPDTPYFHTRNTPCFTNLGNEFIDQTAFEPLGGASCNSTRNRWQGTSFPADSPSFPTVDYLALFTVCVIRLFVSPTRRSVQPHVILNSATQVYAVVIRVMSNSSEAGVSVFNYADLGAKQRFTRVLIML